MDVEGQRRIPQPMVQDLDAVALRAQRLVVLDAGFSFYGYDGENFSQISFVHRMYDRS